MSAVNPEKVGIRTLIGGRGTKKAPVVGIVERDGRVIARFMPKINGENLFNFIIGSIKSDESILIPDEYIGYDALNGAVPKAVVNHKENYVDDDGVTHTNTIEGFWAGIKRAFYGVHYWYSKKWINFYIAEGCYKYNERGNEDMFTTLVNDCLGVKVQVEGATNSFPSTQIKRRGVVPVKHERIESHTYASHDK